MREGILGLLVGVVVGIALLVVIALFVPAPAAETAKGNSPAVTSTASATESGQNGVAVSNGGIGNSTGDNQLNTDPTSPDQGKAGNGAASNKTPAGSTGTGTGGSGGQ